MDFSLVAESQGRWLVAGLVLAAPLAWMVWRLQRPSRPGGSTRALDAVDTVIGWPPEATRMLTHRHRRAYEVLRRAMPEYLIFAQVPVSRFIRVPTRVSYAEWMRRIGHVCVDLVVCDRASNVAAVIEVRETGRGQSERARKRQHRVERVLRAAGVPYQVWDEAWLPDPLAVRKTLLPEMEDTVETASPTIPMDVPAPVFGHTLAGAELAEPPRSTWFDDISATRPAPLGASDAMPPAPSYGVRPSDPALQR